MLQTQVRSKLTLTRPTNTPGSNPGLLQWTRSTRLDSKLDPNPMWWFFRTSPLLRLWRTPAGIMDGVRIHGGHRRTLQKAAIIPSISNSGKIAKPTFLSCNFSATQALGNRNPKLRNRMCSKPFFSKLWRTQWRSLEMQSVMANQELNKQIVLRFSKFSAIRYKPRISIPKYLISILLPTKPEWVSSCLKRTQQTTIETVLCLSPLFPVTAGITNPNRECK